MQNKELLFKEIAYNASRLIKNIVFSIEDFYTVFFGKRINIVRFVTFIFLISLLEDNGTRTASICLTFLLMFPINFFYYVLGESFGQI